MGTVFEGAAVSSENTLQQHNKSRRRGFGLRLEFCLAAGLLWWQASAGAATISPGQLVEGVIAIAGASDSWTFTANAGDTIIARVGDELTNSFTPKIQLLSPTSAVLGTSASAAAAEVAVVATNSGTFTIVISDNAGTQTGSYRLTLAKTGSAIVVSPGDQGGPMTNGVMHTGTILMGDLDVWTVSANAGDAIIVRMGEITDTNTFTPSVRIYSPAGGAALGTSASASAAEVAITAATNGTYMVVVGDGNGFLSGSGDYRLTMVKTGDPVVISAGDDGGPMTNDVMHLGTVLTGDLDTWTFTANAGDAIVVRVGKITDTNTFTPWVRLYSPNGTRLSSSFSANAAEVTATAATNGTYLVVVGDGNGFLSGSGDYRLTLVKTGDPVVVSAGDDGGPMTNDVAHAGTILTGDLDTWTFTANAGDAMVVRVGKITDTNTFTPWVRLYSPNGTRLSSSFSANAAEVSATAATNGTYLVVVGDGNGFLSGSGDYRLTLAKTGDPVVVSAGDNGGPMTNDVMHTGTILTGDLDVWTFTASTGDALVVRVGEITDTNTFTPWVRLYSPTGTLLSSSASASAAEVTATAATNGTFTVIVSDGNGALSGSGDYRLTLAKTGDPVVVSAGDEGGPMTNGVTHTGTILTGDLDVWTFTANAGDSIVARMGEITGTNTFTPWIRLYTPTGVRLDSSASASAAEVAATATVSGTYLVVVGDGNGALSGSGDYRLTLAKSGDPVVISVGDEGGPVTNGFMHTGTILTGDLDVWTFTANAGDAIVARMGEITDTNTFTPWIRLYSPAGGTALSSSAAAAAGEVTATAPVSGTYLLVVGDGNGALSGSGDYRLTLAKTGVPVKVAAGDEGGSLNGIGIYTGTISTGDLDVWSFTACSNDAIVLQMDRLVATNSLVPWIRLYNRSGTLLNTVSGAPTAQIVRSAPVTGSYLLVLGDASGGFGGTGTYQLTASGLSDGMKLCTPMVASGTNLTLSGVGGPTNTTFVVSESTNLTTPIALWIPIRTNQFDQFGVFSFTNLIGPAIPQQYFNLKLP